MGGGNGSGKSTLLGAVAGVFLPDSGCIFLDGKDITSLPEHWRASYLGRVFQDPMQGTLMVTHNMRDAVRYGNRLVMMKDGRVSFEASGPEKQKLTAAQMLEKFAV